MQPQFDSLKQLGLNQKEQDVYLALLQMQKASINDLSARANVKRSTTYNIVYRLKNEGYISESDVGKKHLFIANNPQLVLSRLDEKRRRFKQELPDILSIYNTMPQKPKVAYFSGFEGIKQLYEDTLITLKPGDEILAYVGDLGATEWEEYMDGYVKRRVAKGIRARGIAQKTLYLSHYVRNDKEQLRVTKVVDRSEFPLKNEINIYANKIIIITYKPEIFGVLIESKEIVDTQRTIFEMAWRGIKS